MSVSVDVFLDFIKHFLDHVVDLIHAEQSVLPRTEYGGGFLLDASDRHASKHYSGGQLHFGVTDRRADRP